MPRRPFGQADPTVRADALKRHALVRRMERREKWLERSGIKPELLKEAVETLQAGMHATKLVPAVVDKRGAAREQLAEGGVIHVHDAGRQGRRQLRVVLGNQQSAASEQPAGFGAGGELIARVHHRGAEREGDRGVAGGQE